MEKRRLLKSKLLVGLVVLTAVTLVITLLILAKYMSETTLEGNADLQGFDVSLSIADTSGVDIDASGIVSLTPEQYEKFALSVEKTGSGWAYIRVSIAESWISVAEDGTEMVIAASSSKLEKSSAVTAKDNYFYVNGIVKEAAAISVITGSNTLPSEINDDKKYRVKLSIKVEAVQYNRLETFWKIKPSNYPN